MQQADVAIIDWAVVGVSGLLAIAAGSAAVYITAASQPCCSSLPAGHAARTGHHFVLLWRVRLCFQATVVAYAMAQPLRLQVLWGPQSQVLAGGWHAATLCRVYLGVAFGVLEPAALLLALFACIFALQGTASLPHQRPAGSVPGQHTALTVAASGKTAAVQGHPNLNITFFALGFTLPLATAQLVCALFTRIFDLDLNSSFLTNMFAAYTQQAAAGSDVCSDPSDPDSNCAWCTFPLLSTLISAGFAVAFLLALQVVSRRLAAAAINRRLVARLHVLQGVVSVGLAGSIACRGCTLLFRPFELGFELLRLGHVVLSCLTLAALSLTLVVLPTRDTRKATSKLHGPTSCTPKHMGGGMLEGLAGQPGALGGQQGGVGGDKAVLSGLMRAAQQAVTASLAGSLAGDHRSEPDAEHGRDQLIKAVSTIPPAIGVGSAQTGDKDVGQGGRGKDGTGPRAMQQQHRRTLSPSSPVQPAPGGSEGGADRLAQSDSVQATELQPLVQQP